MLITQSSLVLDWSSEDAKRLRDFLESETGKKVLAHTGDACPALMDGGDVNKTLVRNGEVKGFQLALSTLTNLTTEKPADLETPSNYPSLDDDRAWKDEASTTKQ